MVTDQWLSYNISKSIHKHWEEKTNVQKLLTVHILKTAARSTTKSCVGMDNSCGMLENLRKPVTL